MTDRQMKIKKHLEYIIIGFIFLVLFLLPVLFIRIDGSISWRFVLKIWKDQALLIPLFAINHWVLVPKILFGKKYTMYLLSVTAIIVMFTASYFYHDEVLNRRPTRIEQGVEKRPAPIPPYANLLMYSLLLIGVDTGLMFSKKWSENERKQNRLEKENTEMQLNILRNQISPHFFMNTLNNIFALIDCNTAAAKEAVMKLSKLMRYMLYENQNGKVKLKKEFEFIRSYIDLMKLRFSDEMKIQLSIPEKYEDIEIPALLYISYIENAFKYGSSYQQEGSINISFEIVDNTLLFTCTNTRFTENFPILEGGLGNENNKSRLNLLFGNKYTLKTHSSEKLYNVSLSIPLS